MQRQLLQLVLLLLPLHLKLLYLKLLLPRPLPGRNAGRGRVGPKWPRLLAHTLPPRRPVESLVLRCRLNGCYLGPHLVRDRVRVRVGVGVGVGVGVWVGVGG